MVDKTRQGGAIILEDDSDKSQKANGAVTENESVSDESEEDEEDSHDFGENVIYCEECGYSKDRDESSWFPGDACPKCQEGYLSAD